jgi:putative tryptophan/tyrosine transport system substrate-binding protein
VVAPSHSSWRTGARTTTNVSYRDDLIALAADTRLPALYGHPERARAGGLMAYGADVVDNYRRAAEYVDRILRGARPADLPFQQPVKLVLVLDRRTAKQLGLTISPLLLLQADEAIE